MILATCLLLFSINYFQEMKPAKASNKQDRKKVVICFTLNCEIRKFKILCLIRDLGRLGLGWNGVCRNESEGCSPILARFFL